MKKLTAILLLCSLVLLGASQPVLGDTGTLFRIGEDVEIDAGTHVRTVIVLNGQVTVSGTVDGSIYAVGDSVILTRKAVVKGNVLCVGGVIVVGRGADIRGTVTEVNSSNVSEVITTILSDDWEGWSWIQAIFSIIIFLTILVISVILAVLMPKPIGVVADAIGSSPLKSSLWGLLGMILVMPLMLLLAVSVIGIVLIPLEFILVICACLFGFIAMSLWVGRRVIRLFHFTGGHPLREVFWGLVVLWFIGWIPAIGWMIKVVALMVGFGAVIYTRFGTMPPKGPDVPPSDSPTASAVPAAEAQNEN